MVALVVIVVMRTFVLEPLGIRSSSMVGTLRPGEHVLVDKVTPHLRSWHRGDVVLFRAPPNGQLTIKRVVGLAGDSVEIRDGVLHVNREPVPEPYVRPGAIDGVYYGPTRVGTGEVFLLGDNRRNSLDSRQYGGVPVSSLSGRVRWVAWPLDESGTVR